LFVHSFLAAYPVILPLDSDFVQLHPKNLLRIKAAINVIISSAYIFIFRI
jgi:hypothetical protein